MAKLTHTPIDKCPKCGQPGIVTKDTKTCMIVVHKGKPACIITKKGDSTL